MIFRCTSHKERRFFWAALCSTALCLSSCGPMHRSKPSEVQGEAVRVPQGRHVDICTDILARSAEKPLKHLREMPASFLKAHNDIRRLYELPDLVWDDELAAYAQEWANHLRLSNRCTMKHRSMSDNSKRKEYGENLAWNWTSRKVLEGSFDKSPEFATLGWSQECKDFNLERNSCAAQAQCGHFTQVVWKTSKKIGCGVAICDGDNNEKGSGRAELWVCNYDPPGNIESGNKTMLRPF